jgi:hypothetical protein
VSTKKILGALGPGKFVAGLPPQSLRTDRLFSEKPRVGRRPASPGFGESEILAGRTFRVAAAADFRLERAL